MLVQLASPPGYVSGTELLWFTVLFVAATAFWLWMLVDCLTKKRLTDKEKALWVLALFCTHLIGAFLYLVLVRSRRPAGG